jgi:hypothetical protein
MLHEWVWFQNQEQLHEDGVWSMDDRTGNYGGSTGKNNTATGQSTYFSKHSDTVIFHHFGDKHGKALLVLRNHRQVRKPALPIFQNALLREVMCY